MTPWPTSRRPARTAASARPTSPSVGAPAQLASETPPTWRHPPGWHPSAAAAASDCVAAGRDGSCAGCAMRASSSTAPASSTAATHAATASSSSSPSPPPPCPAVRLRPARRRRRRQWPNSTSTATAGSRSAASAAACCAGSARARAAAGLLLAPTAAARRPVLRSAGGTCGSARTAPLRRPIDLWDIAASMLHAVAQDIGCPVNGQERQSSPRSSWSW